MIHHTSDSYKIAYPSFVFKLLFFSRNYKADIKPKLYTIMVLFGADRNS